MSPDAGRTRRLLPALVVLVAVLVVVVLAGRVSLPSLPSWSSLNPFAEETTDRSPTALLESIRDISRYTAAEGTFQQVVDLEDDRRFVPDFLAGGRTLFVAAGTVEASVDLGAVADGAVVLDPPEEGGTVHLTLPPPVLGEPRLDLEASYVASQERGIVDRVQDALGDVDDQSEVYRAAEAKLAEAAQQTELVERAADNTRAMLTGLLGALGYTDVEIDFVRP